MFPKCPALNKVLFVFKNSCPKLVKLSFFARPAMIFMHGDLGWDQLQLMISKSTTADLLKMFYKLEEFFSQQFKSSKRVFSSLQPRTYPKSSSFKKKQPHAKKKSTTDGKLLTNYENFHILCNMGI